jgi:hypothetical protein
MKREMTIRTPGFEVLIGIVVMIPVAVMDAQMGQILIAAFFTTEFSFALERKKKSAHPIVNVAVEEVTESVASPGTENRAYIFASQTPITKLASFLAMPTCWRFKSSQRSPFLSRWIGGSSSSQLRDSRAVPSAEFICSAWMCSPLKTAFASLAFEPSKASHLVLDKACSRAELRDFPFESFLQKFATAAYADAAYVLLLTLRMALFRAVTIRLLSTMVPSPKFAVAGFTDVIGFDFSRLEFSRFIPTSVTTKVTPRARILFPRERSSACLTSISFWHLEVILCP